VFFWPVALLPPRLNCTFFLIVGVAEGLHCGQLYDIKALHQQTSKTKEQNKVKSITHHRLDGELVTQQTAGGEYMAISNGSTCP